MADFKLCTFVLAAVILCTFVDAWGSTSYRGQSRRVKSYGYHNTGYRSGNSHSTYKNHNNYNPNPHNYHKTSQPIKPYVHRPARYYTAKPTPKTIYNVKQNFERAFCENGVGSDGKKDGKYAHPNECEKYIVCHGFGGSHSNYKKVEVKTCEDGLFFNSKKGICDWPSEVDCFLYQGRACYGAKNMYYGMVKATQTGYLRGMKLFHVDGYVTCKSNKPTYKSFWGCNTKVEGFKYKINTWVTTSDDKQGVVFPNHGTAHDAYGNYNLEGYNQLSPYLMFYHSPTHITKVHRGHEMRIWYGEDLFAQHTDDNAGHHCVDVYALFSFYRPHFYLNQDEEKH